MDSNAERTIKRTQEQAVASWIAFLNQTRLDELIRRLNLQDMHLEDALQQIQVLKEFIGDPSHILGNVGTKHGEIAEYTQACFSNARQAIKGFTKEYSFSGVGRTAPEDYLKNGLPVQSKFHIELKSTLFGTNGLKSHLETYPDFIKNGGSYDIPRDQYKKMVVLLDKLDNSPSQLSTKEYNLAVKIKEFLKEKNLDISKDIQPAVVDYDEVQKGVINETINKETDRIEHEDEKLRQKARYDTRATLKEGAKAASVSAAMEGGTAFALSVAAKLKQGKKLAEFTEDDWKEVGIETGKGTLKGGIRGGAIYSLTNFTPVNANVACAFVTASFGVAAQIQSFEKDNLSPEEFLINCETICLDSAISAVAALAGLALIPGPVLGAIVGSFVGNILYTSCQKIGSQQTQRIVQQYQEDVNDVIVMLDERYALCVKQLQESYARFQSFEELAFSEDVNIAFDGSIKLAMEAGVPANQILTSIEQIDDYFLS